MTDVMKPLDDASLRVKGVIALNCALGPVAALRFLSLLHREPTDYVEISRRLYEDQTVHEVFDRAARNWKG